MELKIVNHESENLATFLGITPERLLEISTEISKCYFYYMARIEHGFDSNTDENNLLVDIVKICKTLEEVVFFSATFEKTLHGVLQMTAKQRLKQTKFN
jgi:hypothetical protein